MHFFIDATKSLLCSGLQYFRASKITIATVPFESTDRIYQKSAIQFCSLFPKNNNNNICLIRDNIELERDNIEHNNNK